MQDSFAELVRVLNGTARDIGFSPALEQTATGHGLLGEVLLKTATGDPRLHRLRAQPVLILGEAKRIAGTMTTEGVRSAALKGTDLIERLQLDPASRPMSDLDILVPSEDRATAAMVLRRQGYRLFDAPEDRLDRMQAGAWRFLGENPVVVVELHDRTFPGSRLRFGHFTSGGKLTPEGALYWLARNCAWHGFSERLLFVYDLHRFLTSDEGRRIDAGNFNRLLEAGGERRLVRLALRVANYLFGTPVEGLLPLSGAETQWVARCADGGRPLPFGPRSLMPILMLDDWNDCIRELWYGLRRRMARDP